MKKIILLLLFLRVFVDVYSQTPTITTLSPIQASYCAGGNIIVTYETTGSFSSGNFFTAQLSDLWGNFSNPVSIGTVPINTGIILGTIPSNTSFGINYRIRVVSSNPYIEGTVSPSPPIIITSSAISAIVLTSPDDTVCFGDSIRLMSNLNESYVWSTGETTQSIYVTESGTYNVTVTNYYTGCEVTSDDKIIVVNPLPDINLGVDTGICDGDILILNAGANYVSYQWNDSLSISQAFFVQNTGTYYVSVEDTNGCINNDTINVVVNLNPVVDLGNDTSFCGNVYFLDAGNGYISYKWNNGLSNNQVLQINHAGTYFVLVTDTNHCKDIDSVDINIMHIPYLSLGNDIMVCGSSLTLNAGSGYSTYDWNDGTADTQYFTAIQSGEYYVVIIDSNNCRVSDTINITFNPEPLLFIGNDFIIGANQQIFLDAGGGFIQYLWNDGSTGQTLSVNSSDLGEGVFTFWVNIIDGNGCYNSDSIIITVDYSSAVNEVGSNNLCNVFPNPFNENAIITFNNLNKQSDLIQLNTYDILGRQCFFNYSISHNNITVNATNQKKGIYSFVITQDNAIIQKGRFVVN